MNYIKIKDRKLYIAPKSKGMWYYESEGPGSGYYKAEEVTRWVKLKSKKSKNNTVDNYLINQLKQK